MAEKSWLDANPERTARKAECLGPIQEAVKANAAMAQTDLPCEGRIQGKVRDIYDLPNGHLLLCATDRQSAFDRCEFCGHPMHSSLCSFPGRPFFGLVILVMLQLHTVWMQ